MGWNEEVPGEQTTEDGGEKTRPEAAKPGRQDHDWKVQDERHAFAESGSENRTQESRQRRRRDGKDVSREARRIAGRSNACAAESLRVSQGSRWSHVTPAAYDSCPLRL